MMYNIDLIRNHTLGPYCPLIISDPGFGAGRWSCGGFEMTILLLGGVNQSGHGHAHTTYRAKNMVEVPDLVQNGAIAITDTERHPSVSTERS